MANDDDGFEDYSPGYGWDDRQSSMVEHVAEYDREVLGDQHALDLIDAAFFDMDLSRGERDLARAEAAFYFDDEFGIDLFDVWDYDDYRGWYDGLAA